MDSGAKVAYTIIVPQVGQFQKKGAFMKTKKTTKRLKKSKKLEATKPLTVGDRGPWPER